MPPSPHRSFGSQWRNISILCIILRGILRKFRFNLNFSKIFWFRHFMSNFREITPQWLQGGCPKKFRAFKLGAGLDVPSSYPINTKKGLWGSRFHLFREPCAPCISSMPISTHQTDRRFSPEGDGGSGQRPLPPNHFTFW